MMKPGDDDEKNSQRVLVVTPTGRDAQAAAAVLEDAGIKVRVCHDLPELCGCAAKGAGALLVASEAITVGGLGCLGGVLSEQPKWSDLPVVLLTAKGEEPNTALRGLFSAWASVTLLERPFRALTLVSVLRSALRARQRQYETRDLLNERAEMLLRQESLTQAARHAQEEAEQANRLKDQFLGTVSHELRNPLNAILGWVKMLSAKKENVDKGLAVIERNAKAQAALVEDLLDVTRAASQKLTLDLQPVDLTEAVRVAAESMRKAAEDKGVTLRECIGVSSAICQADPDRLQQIVGNLLSNAIKFTPANGIIEVRLSRAGEWFKIVVTDNGIGIDPSFLPRLFDRFAQADESGAARHSGLGLGLSIVKHLVELHGGSVSAESKGKGQGATFTVTLPAAKAME